MEARKNTEEPYRAEIPFDLAVFSRDAIGGETAGPQYHPILLNSATIWRLA